MVEPMDSGSGPSSINKSNSPLNCVTITSGLFNGVFPVLFTDVVVIGNPSFSHRFGPNGWAGIRIPKVFPRLRLKDEQRHH